MCWRTDLESLTKDFYAALPHKKGQRSRRVIDSKRDVAQKQDLCQVTLITHSHTHTLTHHALSGYTHHTLTHPHSHITLCQVTLTTHSHTHTHTSRSVTLQASRTHTLTHITLAHSLTSAVYFPIVQFVCMFTAICLILLFFITAINFCILY